MLQVEINSFTSVLKSYSYYWTLILSIALDDREEEYHSVPTCLNIPINFLYSDRETCSYWAQFWKISAIIIKRELRFIDLNNLIQKLLVHTPSMKISVPLLLLAIIINASHSKYIPHELAEIRKGHNDIANVNTYVKTSNLEASNWVLGSLTLDQYYAKRFQTTTLFSTSLCPVETPFVLAGSTDCAQCPLNTPIFSLETDTCITCPNDETYSLELKQCLSKNATQLIKQSSTPSQPASGATLTDAKGFTNITNLDAGNWILGNMTLDQYYTKRFEITKAVNTVLCPISAPFVLSGQTACQQCPLKTPLFSLEDDKCISCPQGEIYNSQSYQCQNPNATQPPKTNLTSPTPSLPSQPLSDTSEFTNISNLDAGNWVLGDITLEQYYSKRFQITKTVNTTLCPLATPYVVSGQTACQQCPQESPIFSLEVDQCIGCPQGEIYNKQTNQCSPNTTQPAKIIPTSPITPSLSSKPLSDTSTFTNVTNIDASNWVLGNLTIAQYYAKRFEITKAVNTTLCPLATPYVLRGSTSCQQCPPETPIFSLELDACIGCQDGEVYSQQTKHCQNENQTIPIPPAQSNQTSTGGTLVDTSKFSNITNLNAPNWILGNITIEEYYVIRFNITKSQDSVHCDLSTPFVMEGQGGACSQCPEETPIFVLQNSTCLGCQEGTEWNQLNQNCTEIPKKEPAVNVTQPATNKTEPTNATQPAANVTQPTANTTQPAANVTQPAANATQPVVNITEPKPNPNLNGTKVTSPTPNIAPNVTNPSQPTPNATQPNKTQPANNTSPTPKPKLNETKVTAPTPNVTKPAEPTTNNTSPVNNTQPATNNTQPTPTPNKNATKVTSPNPTPTTTPSTSNTTVQTPTETFLDIDFCNEYKECPAGQFFNYDSSACQKCQPGQYFSSEYLTCLYCPDDTPFLDSTFACTSCPSGKSIDRALNKCL